MNKNLEFRMVRRNRPEWHHAALLVITLGLSLIALLLPTGCSERIVDRTSSSFRVTADQSNAGVLDDITTTVTIHDLAAPSPAQETMNFINYSCFVGEFLEDSLFLMKTTLHDRPSGYRDYYLLRLPLANTEPWEFASGPENPFNRDTVPETSLNDGNLDVRICRSTLGPAARMVWFLGYHPLRFGREILIVPVDSVGGALTPDGNLNLTVYWQGSSQPQTLTVKPPPVNSAGLDFALDKP